MSLGREQKALGYISVLFIYREFIAQIFLILSSAFLSVALSFSQDIQEEFGQPWLMYYSPFIDVQLKTGSLEGARCHQLPPHLVTYTHTRTVAPGRQAPIDLCANPQCMYHEIRESSSVSNILENQIQDLMPPEKREIKLKMIFT